MSDLAGEWPNHKLYLARP